MANERNSQGWLDEISAASADISDLVDGIAERLVRRWPAAVEPRQEPYGPDENEWDAQLIPFEHAEQLGQVLTRMIAEILQAWLDAGSEREVTDEELGPVIVEHVWGWSSDPRLGPDSSLTFEQARNEFRQELGEQWKGG
jgi:hypothetical protein